ncbi:MAG TPA: DUF86 domain-containing protein [Pyrinomonadaceae bacterium]|nr:DUF86 domain-containing protein [Pyrinomonadaceae bacterium]
MSKRSDRELLSDIRESIQRISEYLTGFDYQSFLKDTKTQDAVIRNLEILGEATKRLSQEFRTTHTGVPWKSMAGARDRLIHDYFGVNLDVVWQIVTVELPKVVEQLPNLDSESRVVMQFAPKDK